MLLVETFSTNNLFQTWKNGSQIWIFSQKFRTSLQFQCISESGLLEMQAQSFHWQTFPYMYVKNAWIFSQGSSVLHPDLNPVPVSSECSLSVKQGSQIKTLDNNAHQKTLRHSGHVAFWLELSHLYWNRQILQTNNPMETFTDNFCKRWC
jgi:hypothetical protein